MVLVIGSLGRWGRGKTMTLTMLQEVTKTEPETLEFKKPQVIVSNYLSKFMDYYVAINPTYSEVFNKFTGKKVPVLDLFEFLGRPVGDTEYFMFLDDVYSWLASYYFGNAFNQAAFRLLAAGRKKGISIGESSVRFKDVDPRLRALHTHLFLPKYIDDDNVVKIERYAVDVFEDVRIYPDLYYDASRYFDAYDTKEIIESVYDSKPAVGTVSSTPSKPLLQQPAPKVTHPPPITPAVIPKPESLPGPNAVTPFPGRAEPKGDIALYDGIVVQHDIAQEWRNKYPPPEYQIVEGKQIGRGHRVPDILVLTKDAKPIEVVSVKCFTLVPSSERIQNGKHSGVNSRTIHRSDILPEINVAIQYQIPCYLVIVNLKNQKRVMLPIDPQTFDHYSTTSELTNGSSRPQQDMRPLVEELVRSGHDQRIVDAFAAKETDPAARRMSNKELSEKFQINQTDLERGIQDIKLKLSKIKSQDNDKKEAIAPKASEGSSRTGPSTF